MFSPETRVGFLPAELYMYPMITGREFLQFYVTAHGLSCDAARLERLNAAFELPPLRTAPTGPVCLSRQLAKSSPPSPPR